MTNNSHFPIHSATEMLRLSAEGGDTDLIVVRKYGKNDWALKISLHYPLWWQWWETEVIKAIAIYIKSIFHKLKKRIYAQFSLFLILKQSRVKILSSNYSDIITNMNVLPTVLWYFISFSPLSINKVVILNWSMSLSYI